MRGLASLPIKVTVLGASGMLGHKMVQQLRSVFPSTTAIMRKRKTAPPFCRIDLFHGSDVWDGVDCMDAELLQHTLAGIRPDFIVNCAGIIKQRPQANDAATSIAINALLPHQLAAWAGAWGGRVIHFSTDCVFSGLRGGYTEEDPSDAQDLYGRSKFLGEVVAENALTLRTSMIGREIEDHRSLLEWFLSQKGRSVHGYRRVICSGVTTNHLADLVTAIIEDYPELSGLFQVASAPISKYELLCLLRDAYSADIDIEPDDREVSDRSMCGDKLRRAIGYVAPSWPNLVQQLAADPTPYERWLSQ
jgi:dTDP-4-dehydrorhamnose reductase